MKLKLNLKNIMKKAVFIVNTIALTITFPLTVFAEGEEGGGGIGNPWAALSNHVSMDDVKEASPGTRQVAISLYRIFQRIGIYGCIITTIIALATLVLRWGDPRVQSENKDKVIMKFVVCFVICASAWILGLILEIVKKSTGY